MSNKDQELIPFITIASLDFEKDIATLKKILNAFEKKTHSEKAYRFSDKAQMAAGWWFYEIYFEPNFIKKIIQLETIQDKKFSEKKIIDIFHKHLKQHGSKARVRLYKDVPFMARWWAWLMK